MVNTADESSLQSIRPPPKKGAGKKKEKRGGRNKRIKVCLVLFESQCTAAGAVIRRSKAVKKKK